MFFPLQYSPLNLLNPVNPPTLQRAPKPTEKPDGMLGTPKLFALFNIGLIAVISVALFMSKPAQLHVVTATPQETTQKMAAFLEHANPIVQQKLVAPKPILMRQQAPNRSIAADTNSIPFEGRLAVAIQESKDPELYLEIRKKLENPGTQTEALQDLVTWLQTAPRPEIAALAQEAIRTVSAKPDLSPETQSLIQQAQELSMQAIRDAEERASQQN